MLVLYFNWALIYEHSLAMILALEDLYRFRAMVKSKALISGKFWKAMVILLKLNFSLFVKYMAFKRLVMQASLGMAYVIHVSYYF